MRAAQCFVRGHADLIETHYHPRWPVHVVSLIIDFLFGVLYTVLLVRLLLELINASHRSGFFQFILWISDPFFAPFRGIVGSSSLYGSHNLVWPIVIAIIAYMILHALIRGLFRLIAHA